MHAFRPAWKAAARLAADKAQVDAKQKEMAKVKSPAAARERLMAAKDRDRAAAKAAKEAGRAKAKEWQTPKLGVAVWVGSLIGCALLLALTSLARGGAAPTVLPLLPVWGAQQFTLSAQCGKGRWGRDLLPALRTAGAMVASITACIVLSIPDATLGLRPERRSLLLGPAFILAALGIAADAAISTWPRRPARAQRREARAVEASPEEAPTSPRSV